MTNVNTNEMTVVVGQGVVKETDKFVVQKTAEGKFVRKAKYESFNSIVAETRADKIWLMNVLEATDEASNGLKDFVGAEIEVQDVITRPYDRINEETGEQEYGVLTYLVTPDRTVYVTSSKSVYFTITRILELFGKPNEADWENIIVRVLSEKSTNGNIIKIKMIG